MTTGLDVGGYDQKPDWPKMGPSLLIASCLILAVRTAKWSLRSSGGTTSDCDLDKEIDHAVLLAARVLSHLVSHRPGIFPQKPDPWFMPNGEDVQE